MFNTSICAHTWSHRNYWILYRQVFYWKSTFIIKLLQYKILINTTIFWKTQIFKCCATHTAWHLFVLLTPLCVVPASSNRCDRHSHSWLTVLVHKDACDYLKLFCLSGGCSWHTCHRPHKRLREWSYGWSCNTSSLAFHAWSYRAKSSLSNNRQLDVLAARQRLERMGWRQIAAQTFHLIEAAWMD